MTLIPQGTAKLTYSNDLRKLIGFIRGVNRLDHKSSSLFASSQRRCAWELQLANPCHVYTGNNCRSSRNISSASYHSRFCPLPNDCWTSCCRFSRVPSTVIVAPRIPRLAPRPTIKHLGTSMRRHCTITSKRSSLNSACPRRSSLGHYCLLLFVISLHKSITLHHLLPVDHHWLFNFFSIADTIEFEIHFCWEESKFVAILFYSVYAVHSVH